MSGSRKQKEGASSTLTIKCPTCGKPTVYSAKNLYRPFCSQLCLTSDLAAWASDEYKVPGPSTQKGNLPNNEDIDESDY
jgi:endogenous inhibitor of DNA gyrase (YacG/DUF329 family)